MTASDLSQIELRMEYANPPAEDVTTNNTSFPATPQISAVAEKNAVTSTLVTTSIDLASEPGKEGPTSKSQTVTTSIDLAPTNAFLPPASKVVATAGDGTVTSEAVINLTTTQSVINLSSPTAASTSAANQNLLLSLPLAESEGIGHLS